MNKPTDKFDFNISFQWDIIKYTLIDPKGYQALLLYDYRYFDLLDQQIIVRTIDRYYSRRNRVPGKYSTLWEELKYFYKHRDYISNLKNSDRTRVEKKVKALFNGGIKDSDEIIEKVRLFASYVQVKQLITNFDISNYDDYERVANRLKDAVITQKEVTNEKGSFLVQGLNTRLARRRLGITVFPTPFKQLNRTMNGGGLPSGAISVIMDKEKGGKTLSLVNIAKGYLRLRKKVCVIDVENGQESIEDRLDQSVGKLTERELRYKEAEIKLKKIYRKYSRIGSELYVKRIPAGSNFNDIDKILNELKEDFGFVPNNLIVDYVILMSPIKDRGTSHDNISQVYIDFKNLVHKWGIDSGWTANHIKYQAYKRRSTRYISGDAAKALDVGRHADLILGVNQNKEEELANIFRWEVVDQRKGSRGRTLFTVNHGKQDLTEFTNAQIDEYKKLSPEITEDEEPEDVSDI